MVWLLHFCICRCKLVQFFSTKLVEEGSHLLAHSGKEFEVGVAQAKYHILQVLQQGLFGGC